MKYLKMAALLLGTAIIATLYFNCSPAGSGSVSGISASSTAGVQNRSVSGAAAVVVGGGLNFASANGSFALRTHRVRPGIFSLIEERAEANNTCPLLFASGTESTCVNDLVDTNAVDLIYENCVFNQAAPTSAWSGTLKVSASNGTAVHCGHVPTLTNAGLWRQFVDESGNPGIGRRETLDGGVLTIDNAAAGGGMINFENQMILPTIANGFGIAVQYNDSGVVDQVSVAEHIFATDLNDEQLFDQSIIGTVNVSDSNGWHIANSTMTVYDNILQVIGTTTFTDVLYNNTCCSPVSGSISTTFSAGQNQAPSSEGQAYVNKSETLIISGCGQGTLTDVLGKQSSVSLSCF